ncbi:hypothetical protein SAMN05428969_0808 [Devosia sp. YR412]|uniref:hypothetical protein n=1 Tax=Devosia sp. YR412 TaxID=1881030 RepID=UPI0008BF2B7C|nr:hypothetical protein [Devosia sp. YR412]SEP76498.1 hypothetical protein SAMN05428969_0808 [Devosia sp. YR412]
MSLKNADFVIIGSTPLARLVAGLLASVHGKAVVFAGESHAGYHLPRGMDLSVAPITRPETWDLLKPLVAEMLKLLPRIGARGSWSRVDPVLFAEAAAGKEALAHIRHMALAFRHGAEPVGEKALGPRREGVILRDAILLHRPRLEAALDHWLDKLEVHRMAPVETLTMHPDGSAELHSGDQRMAITQTVLADDTALLHHLPIAQWPSLLQRQVTSTIVTEPTKPLAAPVMLQLDAGLALAQQPGRGITAIGAGRIDPFAARLGVLLGRAHDFRQAGQLQYERIATSDSAPAVGRLGATGPDVLAGLGPTGAFFAPAIARWLSGVANPAENAWFGARLVDRQIAPSLVAEVTSP